MKKVILITLAIFLTAGFAQAEQPFAPKAKTKKHVTIKQRRCKSKNTWSCAKSKKTNRKGLIRKSIWSGK